MTASESRLEEHRALMARAAALRARQAEESDAVALVREGCDELEHRGGSCMVVGVGLGRSRDGRSAAETVTEPVARPSS